MPSQKIKLSRSEKILVFLLELSGGTKKKIRYEDIVVGLFKKFPEDFHLRGYNEYPDSGDLVHKPLYDFKKRGFLTASNKVFMLTDSGIELAERIKKGIGKDDVASTGRFSRSVESEIARIKTLEGFTLFSQGEEDKISENDFYNYLGVTVRTPKNTFIGRLNTIKDVINEVKTKKDEDSVTSRILKYHDFLFNKFQHLQDYFSD